jgi:nitrate reductase beta subunit
VSLRKLAAMRSYMRDINLGRDPDASIPEAVGMGEEEMYEMFRLLAIAKYNERYVIPTAHAEQAHRLEEIGTDCAVSAYDHSGDAEPFGVGSGPEVRIAVEDLRIRTARMKDDA